MTDKTFDIGIIGLGVMGRNFALNITDHGYSVIGLDTDVDKAAELEKEGQDHPVEGTADAEKFVSALKKPRNAMMLVPAGNTVDAVIEELQPILDEGDLIIDGGNSHFRDTDRRFNALEQEGIHYMGVGISGGEKGARHGPSIMPGGSEDAYSRIRPIFEAAAARVEDEPCVSWLGTGSAGHYVKMVHNGIEYGIMQLIAECYDLMKRGLGFSNDRLHKVFHDWNKNELESYLVEITSRIFIQPDDRSDGRLIDAILDRAKQKGTGQWTSQEAMELQVPTPTIDLAVGMRALSANKEERVHASQLLEPPYEEFKDDEKPFVKRLHNALYFGMVVTYAQGLAQLQAASTAYNYNLTLADVAKLWRGGCIIRSGLLKPIRSAYTQHPNLANLMVATPFSKELNKRQSDLRFTVRHATKLGIPVPALMTCLAYFDGYRSERLPANLIQAQRDYFGSHTYERMDSEGTFHTNWDEPQEV